jgi:polyisoprenoid-binding protein YceI
MKKIKWILDPMHSEILFKVKHLMITTVTGHFGTFKAEAITEGDNFNRTTDIRFTADVHSLYTNNSQRDAHLRSPDFFNADVYPLLTFTAKEYNPDEAELTGELTIRDITRPITLQAEFSGTTTDPLGQIRAGFSLEGKLNRKDFGLHWNILTEAGGVVVGDEVKISAEIQFTKEEAKPEGQGTEEMVKEKITT